MKINKSNLEISIIIPAYNEETNIRLGSLDKVIRYLDGQNFSWELIVVDDGSNDNTAKLLDHMAKNIPKLKILHNEHLGKAGTVIRGMQEARGEIILFTDLDQATPIEEVNKLIVWFSRGFDVVIGSRSSNRQGAPILRLIMARGFMFLRGFILGLKGISDTQCGFKAFRFQVIRSLIPRLRLYQNTKSVTGAMVTAGFDVELLYLSKILGYKIKEVPVEWHYVETRRVNPIKDSWQGLYDILRIKVNSLKGYYKP